MSLTSVLNLWPPFRVGEPAGRRARRGLPVGVAGPAAGHAVAGGAEEVYLTTSPPAAPFPYCVVNRLYINSAINTSDAYIREAGISSRS